MSEDKTSKSLFEFCSKHASAMFREPEGQLARHYLDPGGPYSKNLWDWDSFWATTALLGMAAKSNDEALRTKTLLHAKGAIFNFLDKQGADGSIPILITPNKADVFSCVAEPKSNMAKPVFGQFAALLDATEPFSDAEAARILDGLERFYACYKTRYLNEATGLLLWANDVAIGVDDDPSTWGRPPFSSASIYLNAFMYMDLKAAASLASSRGRAETQAKLLVEAERLKGSIEKYCRDERDGLYYSVDVLCQQNLLKISTFGTLNANLKPFWNCLPLKVGCWSSFIPLLCGIPDASFAKRMVDEHLRKKERFWCDYGIRTLAADERMYSPEEKRGNPSNWLGPVWIIANYIVWKGLAAYGFAKEAKELADNTRRLLEGDYARNGVLHEYYSPATGKGVNGPGFMNWNLLVHLMD